MVCWIKIFPSDVVSPRFWNTAWGISRYLNVSFKRNELILFLSAHTNLQKISAPGSQIADSWFRNAFSFGFPYFMPFLLVSPTSSTWPHCDTCPHEHHRAVRSLLPLPPSSVPTTPMPPPPPPQPQALLLTQSIISAGASICTSAPPPQPNLFPRDMSLTCQISSHA